MLNKKELKIIQKTIPDFGATTIFNIADLQYYDDKILEKIKDKNLYEQIADINLSRLDGPTIYGGENVWIYKSKTKEHYVYWCHCWGD